MSASVAKIYSETGWDALSGEVPIIVRVLSGAATLEELADAAGERDLVRMRKRLSRLVREGILVQQGALYEATARAFESDRQEGMLTTVARHFLPVIAKVANDPSSGFVAQVDLDLDEAEQEAFCSVGEQALLEELTALTELPAPAKEPWALVVMATSDVPPEDPTQERLMETLRRCARQRATASLAPRSVLRYLEGHFGDPGAAVELVRKAASKLGERRPGRRFSVTYTFCASPRTTVGEWR
ncbi:hypothetical protein [Vulgatibacter incomptus]|uniref:Uncharacterized protein n=1 Tax=Vulgatibacter incomptus TaxID=1391653 RepID=A0A0K1PGF7_9BACT|nr:hypothetical protein [Vulgatibacter incomptus]AKU92189.1 hypothetical protein AKJ08_2576 [Vulgatibacter incomptus]